ncbi:hypothetical protein O181_012879 [Austropuccinia psidii MF-1]|uniref:Uncharacterized protein n=1 Tax=Austropuccinia psidii MF-1 TaxID=1389203 RepID=A0A9Q3BX47_9BASI|nr:hypothetical protein [Austropuccinia psidii MF-1]
MSTLTHPYASAPPLLSMLMLLQHPQDIPPMLAPHLCVHQSLHLHFHRTLKICLQRCHPMSALTHPHAPTPPPYLLRLLPSLRAHTRLIGYSGLLEYNAITEIY